MATTEMISYNSLDEIVFESKHKGYGAYRLRKSYDQHLFVGLLLTVGICLFVMGSQYLLRSEVIIVPLIHDSGPTIPPIIPEIVVKVKLTQARVKPTINKNLAITPVADSIEVETVLTKVIDTRGNETGSVETLGNDVPDFGPVANSAHTEIIGERVDNTIHISVEQMPEFPGGLDKLHQFLLRNVKYPPRALDTGTEGRVYLQFTVGRDGNIFDITVVKGLSQECDAEAIRVLRLMPAWKPGKQNGKEVMVRFIYPISFKLSPNN